MKRKLKIKFLKQKKKFFSLYVNNNYLVMDVRSLVKSCKDDIEELDTKKRIMSMLIMSNYYYILSSAKIYVKHYKRFKYYKIIKNTRFTYTNVTSTETIFRILCRIANRVSYTDLLQETKTKKKHIVHFKDTAKQKETYIDRTSEADPIQHYLLDAFEANYKAILATLSRATLWSLSNELQDYYLKHNEDFFHTYHRIVSRKFNNDFDLFFK
ncbi:hypothetical protein AK88_04159 [Plasmodium fragile]|uniref:Uncharacterized protein n=1 Tax=Plasmodium fragile TaxID=5857 RepID=A0A0D9QGV6_PLAFR|nr:uncharacterized protein AK88_04159 [Plasmodium fragile]KJP86188.1 hypothetical protein AK88_04159 [Plasmodium fragile]